MKIQLASDLHLEFIADFPGERLVVPHPDADLLVLAGDIASGTDAVALFADWPVPVLYVSGNHEAYGYDIAALERSLRDAADGTNVHVLERDRLDVGGVRFVGCTLWTDYALSNGTDASIPEAMATAAGFVTDHALIRHGDGLFSPEDALARHRVARAWLQAELDRPWAGPTVAICHHGIHPGSVHPRYAGDITSAAFVSDLGPLLQNADLWLHGHVHDSFDYRVGSTRVVANPRGYALNRHQAERVDALIFENAAFEPSCLIAL